MEPIRARKYLGACDRNAKLKRFNFKHQPRIGIAAGFASASRWPSGHQRHPLQ
jgi:hypothetical protein